jgi:glucosamine-6-phosphate deaminase
MEVIIRPDADAAAGLAARVIADAIRAKPDMVLGLATGRTMERLYAMLSEMHRSDGLSFARVRTFNLDEYIGLSADDPHSYRHYMDAQLFNNVDIDPTNTHLPNGMADDIDAECAEYERRIADCGGIDLQVLGIGNTGHIGFNEPLSAMYSRTRSKALTPQTIEQNAPLFDNPEDMPRRAITMGVGTILDARRCLLLATGSSKASIIAKAVEGPVTSMVSGSALQMHPKCTVIVDEAAAADLEQQEYYRWLFENEPEWEPYR